MDIKDLKDIPCGKCGSLFFTQISRLKYVSALQNPEGKESIARMVGLVCTDCGCSDSESFKVFEEKQKEEFESNIIPIRR